MLSLWRTSRPPRSASISAIQQRRIIKRNCQRGDRARSLPPAPPLCSARQSTETCRTFRARSCRCSAVSMWALAVLTSYLDKPAKRLASRRTSLPECGGSAMGPQDASPGRDNGPIDAGVQIAAPENSAVSKNAAEGNWAPEEAARNLRHSPARCRGRKHTRECGKFPDSRGTQFMAAEHKAEETTRREVLQKAVFVAPAVLSLAAVPSFARAGSSTEEKKKEKDKEKHKDK